MQRARDHRIEQWNIFFIYCYLFWILIEQMGLLLTNWNSFVFVFLPCSRNISLFGTFLSVFYRVNFSRLMTLWCSELYQQLILGNRNTM